MGSTGYPRGVTFTEAIKEELGLGTYYKVLAKAAGESYEPGRNSTWFALEKLTGDRAGERFLVEALWYPASGNYGPTIKLVDESMGPGTLDVPDRVWNAVPDAPPDSNQYAIEWRRQVAEHKAKYPLRIATDLIEERWYVFPDREGEGDDAPVQYLGKRPSGRTAVKAFLYPPSGGWKSLGYGQIFRLRRDSERYGRARLVANPRALAS